MKGRNLKGKGALLVSSIDIPFLSALSISIRFLSVATLNILHESLNFHSEIFPGRQCHSQWERLWRKTKLSQYWIVCIYLR